MEHDLKDARLSKARRKEYKASVTKLLYAMPPAALKRLDQNVSAWMFHPDVASVDAEYRKRGGTEPAMGFYDTKTRQLHFDGGVPGATAEDTYAHEMSHAIDGPRFTRSRIPAWHRAWKEELGPGARNRLDENAATNYYEGWASFGEAVYARPETHEFLERNFPLCCNFWKGQGLWPTKKNEK